MKHIFGWTEFTSDAQKVEAWDHLAATLLKLEVGSEHRLVRLSDSDGAVAFYITEPRGSQEESVA